MVSTILFLPTLTVRCGGKCSAEVDGLCVKEDRNTRGRVANLVIFKQQFAARIVEFRTKFLFVCRGCRRLLFFEKPDEEKT